MQTIVKQKSTNKRIAVIDALRGITLIGICATHALQHFGAATVTSESPFPWIGTMDEVFGWVLRYLVMGKFFIIFSFLFGLSFFIQMDSASKRGVDFRGRFLWRLILLFIFGLLHSALFRLDILIIYSLLGVPLLIMYNLPNKWLISIALFFLLGGAQLAYVGYKSVAPDTKNEPVESLIERRERWQDTFQYGSLEENINLNLTETLNFKFEFQFGEYGRGYTTLGFFILGLLAGRARFFENLESYRNKFVRYALAALAIVLLLYFVKTFLPQGNLGTFAGWVVTPVENLINILSSFIWVVLIINIYRNERVQAKMDKIVSYGRMGLTNYILQSIIGVFIFSGYGLGWYGLGISLSILLCLVYTIIQIYISHYWLRKFRYGPIEWLWRSGTYLKWQPLIR